MAQLTPYLHFDGNCREAMNFYRDCLGGDLTVQTVGETPAAAQMPPEAAQQVMHASISLAGSVILMASDMMAPGSRNAGNAISMSLLCTSSEEIQTLFGKLAAGGTISMPLADQFWGATYGSLTDKFGVEWMLNFDKSQEAKK